MTLTIPGWHVGGGGGHWSVIAAVSDIAGFVPEHIASAAVVPFDAAQLTVRVRWALSEQWLDQSDHSPDCHE